MSKLKLLFATTVALIAFGALASIASAAAEVDPAGEVAAISEGKVTFGSSPTIACNLTLNHTLASSVELAEGEPIGEITSVNIASCAGGSVSAVLNLPWDISVAEVLGEAPNALEGVRLNINGAAFNLSVFGGFVNCLYSGNAAALLEAFENGGGENEYEAGQIIADPTVQLPFIRGSSLCPREGSFRGAFNLSVGQDILVE